MSKFVLDCDVVSSNMGNINSVGSQMGELASTISSYDVGDCEDFNFAGAIASIASNVEAATNKIMNMAKLLSTVVETHTSVQNGCVFVPGGLSEISETSSNPVNIVEDSSKSENSTVEYVVKYKDTLSGIAATYGTTVSAIAEENKIENPNLIHVGDNLVIPTDNNNIVDNTETEKAEDNINQNNLDSNQKTVKSTVDVPDGLGDVHTYMGWQMITNKDSAQYKLKEAAGMNFDSEGFGKIDDRYVVATTTTFGNVGDYIDFEQADGSIIQCIIGDIKNQGDGGCNKWGHDNGTNIVEFVVDKSSWYGSNHANPGTSSCHPEWNQNITKATNYGNYFDIND